MCAIVQESRRLWRIPGFEIFFNPLKNEYNSSKVYKASPLVDPLMVCHEETRETCRENRFRRTRDSILAAEKEGIFSHP